MMVLNSTSNLREYEISKTDKVFSLLERHDVTSHSASGEVYAVKCRY